MNTSLTQGDAYIQSQQPEEVATKSWEDKNAISILEVTFLIFFLILLGLSVLLLSLNKIP